jgi:integrase
MPRMKLTKAAIDSLKITDKARVTYWDTELTGFCVRASQTAKTYYAKGRVKGKPSWVKIGEHGLLTPDIARRDALKILSDLARGIDVNERKREEKTRGITLAVVIERYFEAMPNLRAGTVYSYKNIISNHLSEWLKKSMDEITGEMVSRKHIEIASKSGQVQANKVMRVLRLMFNHLGVINDTPIDNPVSRLSRARQWFKTERRQSLIREHELKAWYDAVKDYPNPVVRDALLLLLLTGCRKNEVLTLQWSDVDMKGKTFTIKATVAKNHREHTLPMSDAVLDVFKRRETARENEWIFPGQRSKEHITELHRPVEILTGKSEVKFCIHDLRRTFTSLAEQEVSYAVLKRLLNHYTGNDVTAGYLIISTEQLRVPMQKITNRIMKACRTRESRGKVIPIRS